MGKATIGYFLFIALFPFFMACTQTKKVVLYEANCNGNELVLQLVSRTTFEMVYHHHELWYGGKKAALIDYAALSNRLPYDPEVFGTATWHVLDTSEQYFSVNNSSIRKIPVLLYINPEIWSRQEFEALYGCMTAYHKRMQQAINNVTAFQPYQFGGMVYGNEKKFVQRYAKDKSDYFNIHPDGRIEHVRNDESMIITSSGGLAGYVLMPGKCIVIEDTQQIDFQELSQYKNVKTQRSIADDFRFEHDHKPKSL